MSRQRIRANPGARIRGLITINQTMPVYLIEPMPEGLNTTIGIANGAYFRKVLFFYGVSEFFCYRECVLSVNLSVIV